MAPTTESPKPSANKISVPDGRNEQIRIILASNLVSTRPHVTMSLRVMSTSPVFVSAEENCGKNYCAAQCAPKVRNRRNVALQQSAPCERIRVPSHPYPKVADQIKRRRAQHICRDKTAQADPLAQEPSCKGNGSKGRNLEDHFPA